MKSKLSTKQAKFLLKICGVFIGVIIGSSVLSCLVYMINTINEGAAWYLLAFLIVGGFCYGFGLAGYEVIDNWIKKGRSGRVEKIIDHDDNGTAAHPEDFCQRCGARNTVWFAPNDLWNKVMGGGDIDIVCPECFRKLCREMGEKIIFEAKNVNAVDLLKGQIMEAFSAKWLAVGGANHDYIMNTLDKTISEILG